MIWMEEHYWEHFVKTGKVEDYLCYRGVEKPKDMACAQTEKSMTETGERRSESGSHSDRNDIVGSSGGGVR